MDEGGAAHASGTAATLVAPAMRENLEQLAAGATSLALSAFRNQFTSSDWLQLADALKASPPLTSLRLFGYDDAGPPNHLMVVIDALHTNTVLTKLSVRATKSGEEAARALAALLTNNSTITSLDFGKDTTIGANGLRVLASALKTNLSLTVLKLPLCGMGDDGARALAAALEENSSLTMINVVGNNLSADGVCAFANALTKNQTLKTLTFGGSHRARSANHVGDDGARALGHALKINSTLTSLAIGSAGVCDAGARALADALTSNTSLLSLYTGSNFGDDGACALADALKINRSLTHVDIEGNAIGDDGVHALANALETNASLVSLEIRLLRAAGLTENHVGDDGARALAAALHTNTSLTSLVLCSDNVRDGGASALADALKTNLSLTSLRLGHITQFHVLQSTSTSIDSHLMRNKLVLRSTCTALRTARRVLLVLPSAPAIVVDIIIGHADARCTEHLTAAQRHALVVVARARPVRVLTRAEVLQVVRRVW